MSVLSDVRGAGIDIRASAGTIVLEGRKSLLTTALLDTVKGAKAEIIAELEREQDSQTLSAAGGDGSLSSLCRSCGGATWYLHRWTEPWICALCHLPAASADGWPAHLCRACRQCRWRWDEHQMEWVCATCAGK